MVKPGARKFYAFLITIALYSTVVLIATFLLKEKPEVLPSFAFQLASAFGILCGLFFGSNVLEHYSRRNGNN